MAAELPHPDAAIIRDAILFPADGGTPCIAPMKFLAREGATTSAHWSADLDIAALYRSANVVATREKSWTVGNGGNRRAYMLLYNMSPLLPINLSMAQVVNANPTNPGQRLLWRGDAWVIHVLPEVSDVGGRVGAYYLNTTMADIGPLTSLQSQWYNSSEWRGFLRYEESRYRTSVMRLSVRVRINAFDTEDHEIQRAVLDIVGRFLERLKATEAQQLEVAKTSRTPNYHRDPYTPRTRNVVLYPAEDGAQPHITAMTFAKRDKASITLGFEQIDLDIPRLWGPENLFSARQAIFVAGSDIDPELEPNEKYTLYYNLNPDLPINRTMARLVDVNPQQPGPVPLWRGDVVVIRWREWRHEHPEYVDMSPSNLDTFSSSIIPVWYAGGWSRILDYEEEDSAYQEFSAVRSDGLYTDKDNQPRSRWNPWSIVLSLTGSSDDDWRVEHSAPGSHFCLFWVVNDIPNREAGPNDRASASFIGPFGRTLLHLFSVMNRHL
ncbi:hypothetical protein C8R43DRAFT_1113768 [Mycena crocata]|nr:hypothetical protein C8R43DRAFT_1113768 [Mycena crocata]